ncbi:MAG TPA: right-handed parallel beta-helix repeat-containing protein [Candidatus Methanoperedens sp.]|nr:right-handed parallel beta-helix repeat-containing protein [Candidatus Methanoperedens sp.]
MKHVALSILLLLPSAVEAKMLYVDGASGNDAVSYANNSPSQPWRTLGRAVWGQTTRPATYPGANASQAARAGDTVIVKEGVYTTAAGSGARNFPIYTPVNSGTAGSPIVITGERRVELRAEPGSPGGPIIGCYRSPHITWDNFYIDEQNISTVPDTGPVVAWDTTYCELRNLEIKSKTAQWNDNHPGIRVEYADYVTISNNKIYDVRGYFGARSHINCPGIQLYKSEHIVIENNEIFNSDAGIFIKSESWTKTQGDITVRYNLLHDLASTGIIVMAADGNPGGKVYQNVIRNCATGITFFGLLGADYGPGPENVTVANNTIHNCSYAGLFLKSVINWSTGNRFWNNLITNSGYAVRADEETGEGAARLIGSNFLSSEHNSYNRVTRHANVAYTEYSLPQWKSSYRQDSSTPTSSIADPLYFDSSNNDFRLRQGSPVMNAGVDILDLDNDGSSTDPVTIGAYVTGNEVIGLKGLNLRIVPR